MFKDASAIFIWVQEAVNQEASLSENDEKLARRISSRYWESDESVNAIVSRFSVSKGRFYDLIRPLPIAGRCPSCSQSPPVHLNRTSRTQGVATCLFCGWEGSVKALGPAVESEPGSAEPSAPSRRIYDADPSPLGGRGTLAGLLVGIAVGLVVSRIVGR